MFSLLWRFFPGPVWVRIIAVIILLVALIWALVFVVYPWIADEFLVTPNDATVGG